MWIATCPHETVEVLASELDRLGVNSLKKLHRGIAFETDLETAYKAHLSLRTASRLQRVVAEGDASTIETFAATLKTISWPEWLRSHRPFNVVTTLTDPPAIALRQDRIHQAVVESILTNPFEKAPPSFKPESEAAISVVVFVRGGRCTIGIDTAGRALHKRGWRVNGHPAVLKETLAASLLLLAGYNGDEPLLDPFCGSGTIVVEAAYIALDKAPLIHRGKDDFALEHLAGFDRALWRRVADALRAAKRNELPEPIYASDIRPEYAEVARKSALKARVEKYLSFQAKPFQEWTPPAPSGLLIGNLPYGERIGGGKIRELYADVGKILEERFAGWRFALLVPRDSPWPLLNPKNHRKLKQVELMNGALAVTLLLGSVS